MFPWKFFCNFHNSYLQEHQWTTPSVSLMLGLKSALNISFIHSYNGREGFISFVAKIDSKRSCYQPIQRFKALLRGSVWKKLGETKP